MNFFQRQDQARRSSRRLVALFALAVIAVVAAVDLVVAVVLSRIERQSRLAVQATDGSWAQLDTPGPMGVFVSLSDWVGSHPGTLLLTTVIVFGIIALASLYKTTLLSGGGAVVASSLGGVRVSADTTDPLQRRLLNVVEEMAIAAGVPMPEVYLLEQERGINAFAAGQNAANAAIGITRGALTSLSRDELQGVIAHEFSHILNGDMRLNVRLMGLLFGLLVIAIIGRTILRVVSRARDGKKNGGVAIVLLIAAALVVIGYVGLFFGRLIQAAVSRTRESLADASAVQFTRDPGGLRGALLKIAATAGGSSVANPEVEEVAHMLFAPGMRRLFATHPPLVERLKAIDPRFDAREIDAARARIVRDAAQSPASTLADDAPVDLPAAAPAAVAGLVGNPGTAHMRVAHQIRQSLPESIVLAGQHPHSARALLLALALDADAEGKSVQRRFISQQLGSEIAAGTAQIEAAVAALDPEQRVPALLRSFPALRQLTREERLQLMACLNGMFLRQGRASLESYVLRKLAQVHLHDDLVPQAHARQLTLGAVQNEAQVLFSVLAQHGHEDEKGARRAYEAGMSRLLPRQRPAYAVPGNWAAPLDRALSRLDRLMPIAKEQLVAAMVETVTHDERLTMGEAELLRTVCASLHCPLPPLVASSRGGHASGTRAPAVG